MRLTLITPPAAEPITLAQAKVQCKVRHDQADAKLTQHIRTARELAEKRTGRALINQGWRQVEDCAPSVLRLWRWPVVSVQRVLVDGIEQDAAAYTVELGDNAVVCPVAPGWRGRRVQVEYTAGYGSDGGAVPGPIMDWMLMQISTLYEHSGAVVIGAITSEIGFVEHLLDHYEVPR